MDQSKMDGGRGDECGTVASYGDTWGRGNWVRDTGHESQKMDQSKKDAWFDSAFQSLVSDPVLWQEQQVFFYLFFQKGVKAIYPPLCCSRKIQSFWWGKN
jgi:hypothetical protein